MFSSGMKLENKVKIQLVANISTPISNLNYIGMLFAIGLRSADAIPLDSVELVCQ